MISIAIPASCIGSQTCYSLEQATYTLFEICRACMLFDVGEIIVYDIPEPEILSAGETAGQPAPAATKKIVFDETAEAQQVSGPKPVTPSWEAVAAANMLQYFVTPVYLRKQLFGKLKMYKKANKLPRVPGQEKILAGKLVDGVAIKKETLKKKGKKSKKEKQDARVTPFVNLGFDHVFELEEPVPVHSRVTIDLKTKKAVETDRKGYTVRAVRHFSQIFTESSIPDGYTHAIYVASQQFTGEPTTPPIQPSSAAEIKNHPRPLLVFGKWSEIECAAKGDSTMQVQPYELFDARLEGTESARLEDSVMVSLARITS